MRKFVIGLVRFLCVIYIALEWFCIPVAAALIPCYLIRRFLFALPYWVLFVSASVSLLVNWLLYPFAMGLTALPLTIWSWLNSCIKVRAR
jgi:hypothetical protein